MDNIQLFEALRDVRDFKPFSVTFVKYSRSKRKGGEIVSFANVVMIKKANNAMKEHQITVRLLGIDEIRTIYIYSILAINGKNVKLRV